MQILSAFKESVVGCRGIEGDVAKFDPSKLERNQTKTCSTKVPICHSCLNCTLMHFGMELIIENANFESYQKLS